MFKLFNKREPKATWIADSESVDGLEDYYKEQFVEYNAALEPLSAEQSKAKFIIKRIYARHGIDSGPSWTIDDNCLDSDVFTDLCEFNEDELASLRKWTQRYKELETEIISLSEKYRDADKLQWTKYLKEHR